MLKIYGATHSKKTYAWQSFEWRGLRFSNRLGIAGGVDKNAAFVEDWWTLGPGFIEVGTVTPKPQAANPGKIMDRNILHKALWNKMGFPNEGAHRVAQNLAALAQPRHTPIFVNVGRNRETPNEEAFTDYQKCFLQLKAQTDVFVINISSPNTQGLRDLQDPVILKEFLQQVLKDPATRDHKPVLLKLSPDLSATQLSDLLRTSLECGVDGWILTNTTLEREAGLSFPKEGGVSGAPLARLAKAALKVATQTLSTEERKNRLLISVGGILSPDDVQERLKMGADLVQVYTALIYEGPEFFKRTAARLAHS